MIGRHHHVVIDCPDPDLLAGFYSELIGLPVTYRSPDWVVIADNDQSSGFAFQRVADHVPQALARNALRASLEALNGNFSVEWGRRLTNNRTGSALLPLSFPERAHCQGGWA